MPYIKWDNKKSDDDMCPNCYEKDMKRVGKNRRFCRSCETKFLNPNRRRRPTKWNYR
jgi:ribosomal protein L37AE/L43A|tara:strand:+ start:42 stop:212 length:171 start_codon:yes stop_codon:yes gene_type:complete